MFVRPVVLTEITMLGASAVDEPLIATTGLASSNSATPPCPRPAGSVWLATTVKRAAVDGDLLRIGPGHGDVRPEESGHPGNPVPVVVGRDEPRVRPVLGERQGLGRRVGGDGYHRKNGEQQGADKPGDGGPMSGGWDQHGGEPPRK